MYGFVNYHFLNHLRFFEPHLKLLFGYLYKKHCYDNNYEALISKRIFVQVESKEEILADKIIALSQRPYLKFRDLWDIEWLINQGIKINNELVALKIKDYSCNNFKEALEKRKEELNNPMLENAFLTEMSRFLEPEAFHQVKNFHFFNTIRKLILQISDTLLEHDFNDENLNLQTTSTIN